MYIFDDLNESHEPSYRGLTEEQIDEIEKEKKVKYAQELRKAMKRVKKFDPKAMYYRPHVARMVRWIVQYKFLTGSQIEMLSVINTPHKRYTNYVPDSKYVTEGKQTTTANVNSSMSKMRAKIDL